MKFRNLLISAAVGITAISCGGSLDIEQTAEDGWADLNSAERKNMCAAMALLGPEFAIALLAGQDDINYDQATEVINYVVSEKCV